MIYIDKFNHWAEVEMPARLNDGDAIWLDDILSKDDVHKLLEIDLDRYGHEILGDPIYRVVSIDWRSDEKGIFQAVYISK